MSRKLEVAESALEKEVQAIINYAGYGVEAFLKDLFQHGCQSGMVSELIYYKDTLPFYEKHKKEISQLLAELCDSTGLPPAELFRDWDTSDALALDTLNQNLLAWFGFEETARKLAAKAEMDVE